MPRLETFRMQEEKRSLGFPKSPSWQLLCSSCVNGIYLVWGTDPVLAVTGNELVFTFSSHCSSTQCRTQQGCHEPAAKVMRERSLGELAGEVELVTISPGLIFLLVPPSLSCHPAWIRTSFCALGKLPSFCDPEKPLGASPRALPRAPAVPVPHCPQHPAGLSHLPAPAAQPVAGSAPAGNQGICRGREVCREEPSV